MIKTWVLAVTDGSYMEVQVFYGKESPTVEEMLNRINFERNEALGNHLDHLKSTVKRNNDYYSLNYIEEGRSYMFHLSCHIPESNGFTIVGS
jgi:hypothetical protein